jgi:hypothetical protein
MTLRTRRTRRSRRRKRKRKARHLLRRLRCLRGRSAGGVLDHPLEEEEQVKLRRK